MTPSKAEDHDVGIVVEDFELFLSLQPDYRLVEEDIIGDRGQAVDGLGVIGVVDGPRSVDGALEANQAGPLGVIALG